MGRKARLKRFRKEQAFANMLVDEMIHDGPAALAVDKWRDLPAPTGSGQTVYVHSEAKRFIDTANAAHPNDPQYTGVWVAETITPDDNAAPQAPVKHQEPKPDGRFTHKRRR